MKIDFAKTYYLVMDEKDGGVIEDGTGTNIIMFSDKSDSDPYFGFVAVPIKIVPVVEK